MSQFEQWFNQALTTGNTSPVRLGMSPDELISVLGEPTNGMIDRTTTPPTIFFYFYQCGEGTVKFNFRDDDQPNAPWAGEELIDFEEVGAQKRIVSKRTYL